MTEANEMHGTGVQELDHLVISDTDESKGEQESFSFHQEADLDDIPPSLLSYLETSKSRAAVCEKLFLEEPEDFAAPHRTEDMMNMPVEIDKDMMTPQEQIICDTENEENNTSTDTRLLPAPTETEALFTHNVSVCPNNEDEAGIDEYIGSEKHFAFEERTLEISPNEEERKKSSEYDAEWEKRHCEEMKREEQKREIERDFQEELKKIIEAEKLHQKELELMGKRAQEKLEQEFLLQQELINNLQRQVEEERRMREEEEKRIKDEEDKRKWEEEKIKIEAERKRVEEETMRKKEEERKIEEMKLKKEEERKKEQEEKRRMEREEKRRREEERNKIDKEKKQQEEAMRMKVEEERKKKEEVQRIKREEERKKILEAREKMEKEKRKMEEEISLKKKEEEEWPKREKERKKREEENMRLEEKRGMAKEIEERKNEEEMRKKKEGEADDRKKMAQEKMYEEVKKKDTREHGNVDEEINLEERRKEENYIKKREEEREEARKKEKEIKMEYKKDAQQMGGKQEGENRKMKEEQRPIKEDEKKKKEDERRTKEEEWRRGQRDDEDYRKSKEEMRHKKDMEGCKGCDSDHSKMEHESKTKGKEKKQQQEERKYVEGEVERNGEEVGENKKEVNKKTETTPEETEESKKRTVQDEEERVVRANELQEKREKREHNSMRGQHEKNNIDETENSTTWTSSNTGPVHSESTICPTSTETTPQHNDLDKNVSQTSIDKTVGCQSEAARPSTLSAFLPVSLLEHTEQKRLSWMKDCVPWSRLSLQNRRKQKEVHCRRERRRVSEVGSLPPLSPDSLLQSTGWRSLQEVTTATLEDLPGCSLSTLAQCTQLRSLSLRRCGLKSLEGINQLPQLCYIDVQENDISFVDCENMTSLRVLQLSHNKLTSIHGLTGAENLDVLDLSHNSITRIAGLESVRRLQRLSVDHNQLINTKGLRDVCTLLHLNCSHNHLASVEGLENSALLNTLDLRANSLSEPPSLNNQVLLRELRLDDNSISSLQGLTACWLPLMQHLSVAQNRITQLPSLSDCVSLANLDLRFNCISELQNMCENLEGCQFLREVHLTGNPLQQESGWRSTLQRAVPGLRAIDDQAIDSALSPPAVQQVSLASGSFLTFCQAQLQQTHDLQQRHSRELSNASSSLDAVKTSCRHFTEALQLATDQRFTHEYGDAIVADKHRTAVQTIPEETLDINSTDAEKRAECPQMESPGKVSPVIPNRNNIRRSYWTFDEKSAAECRHDTVTTGPKATVSKADSRSDSSMATKRKTISSNPEMAPFPNHQNLDLQNTAAAMIQQLWRRYRQKCGNISSPSTVERGGGRGGGKPEPGPSYINGRVVGQDYAATVIQAFWRGFTLRRRLTSALAAVTCPDTGEDDTFEEVDVDEFVFDEAALEKQWLLPLSEDTPLRRYPVSEQPLSLKPPGAFPECSQYVLPIPLVWKSKQAWVDGEQVDSAGQRVSPVSSNRSKSPASTSVVSGLSERSEKILEEWGFTHSHTALLMLKRAQNMKSNKQQQNKRRDASVRHALFRNCSYQLRPVEARNRQGQHNRNDRKVRKAELGLQQAEKTERVKQERAQQWLHSQAAHSDRDSESEHFLPEISSDILNGGRVQLVADPGYTERLHHASGLRANCSLAAQPCRENNYPRRNSLGHAREEVPSPKRVTSAPSKKERISFRDNPVQMSGGWGGGKKRAKVHK